MIVFEAPEIPEHDLILEPENRITRGSGTESVDPLEGWVSIGEPVPVPLTIDSVSEDKDLVNFLKSENAEHFKFHRVHLSCTFRPHNDPFVNAWLKVQLARSDDIQTPQPIAWSMKPRRLEKFVEISRTVKIGASLKILPEVAELGIGSGSERKQTWQHNEVFLEALNELQSDPIWEFTKTDKEPIRKSHRFDLVVRSPKDAVTGGMVSLSATVERKRLGIIPYKAAFPDNPQLTFQL